MRDDIKTAFRSLRHSRGFTVVALTVPQGPVERTALPESEDGAAVYEAVDLLEMFAQDVHPRR
jgi:hypothetical protein